MLTLDDIDQMTRDYDTGWGYAHVQRVLRLANQISEGITHDRDVLTWATYLHDWGAFPVFAQAGMPHTVCSCQIADRDILPRSHFTNPQKVILLEAIEKHDYQDDRSVDSTEALILREADYLDMLGAIGIVREFAWGPNNLQVCYDRILKHRARIQSRFILPIAREIAAQRIASMNIILEQILLDSFGEL